MRPLLGDLAEGCKSGSSLSKRVLGDVQPIKKGTVPTLAAEDDPALAGADLLLGAPLDRLLADLADPVGDVGAKDGLQGGRCRGGRQGARGV